MPEDNRINDDFVPMGMIAISHTGTDLWACSIKANKHLWRSIGFRGQQEINRHISAFQDSLNAILDAEFQNQLAIIEEKNVSQAIEEKPKKA